MENRGCKKSTPRSVHPFCHPVSLQVRLLQRMMSVGDACGEAIPCPQSIILALPTQPQLDDAIENAQSVLAHLWSGYEKPPLTIEKEHGHSGGACVDNEDSQHGNVFESWLQGPLEPASLSTSIEGRLSRTFSPSNLIFGLSVMLTSLMVELRLSFDTHADGLIRRSDGTIAGLPQSGCTSVK